MRFVYVFLGGLFVLIGGMISSPPTGLSPEPIGPYLNGIFPQQTPGNGGSGNWTLVNAYPNLVFADPLSIIQLPDTSGFYVSGKEGYIWKISNDTTTATKTTVLDISNVVDTDGDAGLINLILHPEFGQPGSDNRGYLYIIYRYHPLGNIITNCNSEAYTRLSRFTKTDGSEQIDVNSELVLVQQVDPHCWHTGGGMFFDDEGYFYFTFGDAGSSNDLFNSSQQIDSFLFGGLHRIDVDKDDSRSHPIRRQPKDRPYGLPEGSYTQGYYIPNDNPWVNPDSSVLEEFFALGLRSPHRASFDPVTDQIWVADVGEGSREEISLVEKGDNLQWPFLEGTRAGSKPEPPSIIGNSKSPVYEYSHATGTAVIGGFVYRGEKYNGVLDGKFIFGDHGTRNIWTYNLNTNEIDFIANAPSGGVGDKNGISSFGTDYDGNVYVLKLFGTDLDGGTIYKLKSGAPIPDPPNLLSQTGAFADLSTLTPISGFIPYTVNAPLWSDNAIKKRWVAIPNDGTFNDPGEQVVFSEEDSWNFPPGTVLMKHFELPIDENNPALTARLETRFIVIKDDGSQYGVTYKWNSAGTDATLLAMSDTASYTITQKDLSTRLQVWNFPSRTDCRTCHNSNANGVLGIKTWQLNGDFTYTTTTENQLNAWLDLGIFANPFAAGEINGFLKSASIDDSNVSTETRVRSYLDANCAHCHRPNGVNGAFDARFPTSLNNQNIVNSLGVSVNTPPGSYIVKPKDHEWSELWIRDNSIGDGAMPPLAKSLVDTAYINVLTEWISGLVDSTCLIHYLSDMTPIGTPINGWGPIELDRSNGSTAPNDGMTMTINGVSFAKGIGVHAYSEIEFDLSGQFKLFQSSVGVDDETCQHGNVQFLVYLDDILSFQTPVLTQFDDAYFIQVDVTGKNTLKLVVNDGGDDLTCDHADWANARLIKLCDDGDSCTENDSFDKDCNCAGSLIDQNNDGVCDSLNFDVAIKVFLQGAFISPFSGEGNLMRDDLRLQSLIPSQSPYADSLICDDSVFLTTGPNAIVDWVWIELRDANNSNIIMDSLSALLQRDGDVVAIDGLSPVTFKTGKNNYHLCVKHRNHLAILTNTPVALGFTTVSSVNTTDGSIAVYGVNAQNSMNGILSLWAGDADKNAIVNAGDRSATWNMRNTIGYNNSDCNLNGVTEASDRSITWNNRNIFAQLP